MPVTLPGLPEHVTALAYRAATSDEHFFNPPVGITPGPSDGIVLVVEPEQGWEFRYDIQSDETLVVADEAVPTPAAPLAPDTLAYQRYSFAQASALLLDGSATRIKRAQWTGKWLEQYEGHAPHFTLVAGSGTQVWQYQSTDLKAQDWIVELVK